MVSSKSHDLREDSELPRSSMLSDQVVTRALELQKVVKRGIVKSLVYIHVVVGPKVLGFHVSDINNVRQNNVFFKIHDFGGSHGLILAG